MNTVDVTLGELVDRTLQEVQAPTEVGRRVVRPSIIDASATTFTLTVPDGGTVSVTDLLEFGTELMLVSIKSSDPDPVYTVSRGYYGTTAVAHTGNEVGYVNPQWNRVRVATAVRESFRSLEALGVPLEKTTVVSPTESAEDDDVLVLVVPAEARFVVSVRNDLTEVENWLFIDELPTADYSTGKVVKLPWHIDEDDDFSIVYRAAYRWSSYPDAPDEDDTITVPEGAEHLPAAYAAAWLVESREVSRSEIDRAQEWNANEPTRQGGGLQVLRTKWQSFYRKLDEVRRIDPPIPNRPIVRRTARFRGWS